MKTKKVKKVQKTSVPEQKKQGPTKEQLDDMSIVNQLINKWINSVAATLE